MKFITEEYMELIEKKINPKETLDNLMKYLGDKTVHNSKEADIYDRALGILDYYKEKKSFKSSQVSWLEDMSKNLLE